MLPILEEKIKKDLIDFMQAYPQVDSVKIGNHNYTLKSLQNKGETKPKGLVMVTKYHPKYPIDLKPYEKEGFVSVLIHTSGKTFGGDLSPYILKDEEGHILENIWQFSKVYPKVTAQKQPISRFQPKTI